MTSLQNLDETDSPPLKGTGFQPDSLYRPIGTFELPANLTRHFDVSLNSRGGSNYGLRVLEAEAEKLEKTPEGSRNATLWASGCRIGELIGGAELDARSALKRLLEAAKVCGLGDEEVSRVLLRPDGALITGISSPRNRNGFLHELYSRAVLDPTVFNDGLSFWHPVDWWFKRLDNREPSWKSMEILVKIDELGVLYRSNYMYLLSKVHELVMRNEPGTKLVFETLDAVYRAQADEFEMLFLELEINLGTVIANAAPRDVRDVANIIDFRQQLEEAS